MPKYENSQTTLFYYSLCFGIISQPIFKMGAHVLITIVLHSILMTELVKNRLKIGILFNAKEFLLKKKLIVSMIVRLRNATRSVQSIT